MDSPVKIEILEVAAPYPGPEPTEAEVLAARDRHQLYLRSVLPDLYGPHGREIRVAGTVAARLAQLARAEPDAAKDVAEMLAVCAETLAARHAGCTIVGCPRCLYLADARAVIYAWQATG